MAMSSSMATTAAGSSSRWTPSSSDDDASYGAPPPHLMPTCDSSTTTTTTWGAWAHQGHRLWASMPEEFWVYVYKVQRCPQLGNHLWTLCPYAHRGERARRRDPRRFAYLPVACPSYRASQQLQLATGTGAAAPACVRGARCRYAHGVFELWLHPARFRTRMCEGGVLCPRRICFFAHSLAERRSELAGDALVGLPPLHVVPRAPLASSLPSGQQVVDILARDMAGRLRLYDGGGDGGGASSSSSRYRPTAAKIVVEASCFSPDGGEDDPPGGNCASEESSVAGDYPHLDLIRDMVMS